MLSNNLSLDIQQAELVLKRWLKNNVRCESIAPLDGGMINTVFRLDFDRSPNSTVIKMNRERDSSVLKSEHRRLDYLRNRTNLPVPETYDTGYGDDDTPFSYLLLETLPGVNLSNARTAISDRTAIDRELAEVLVNQHGLTRPHFGRIDEEGVLLWSDVMVPELLSMREHMQGRLSEEVIEDIDEALSSAGEVFVDQGNPTLTHGDIWAGNIIVEERGGRWHLSGLVDPSAAKFTDVELELAYLEVFETVGPAFYEIYNARYPGRPGYKLRRLYYWLNTYMIHVWLFGNSSYCDRTAGLAREILRYTR